MIERPPGAHPTSWPSAAILTRCTAGRCRTRSCTRWRGPARTSASRRCDSTSAASAGAPARTTTAIGESEDAAAVADFAMRATGAARFWSLGFSFGGFVAYRSRPRAPPRALVTVAPPVQRFDFTRLPVPRCPWFVAQGDADELVDHERVLAWTRTPGAGAGSENPLRRRALLPRPPDRAALDPGGAGWPRGRPKTRENLP